jgi:hypothetical protein
MKIQMKAITPDTNKLMKDAMDLAEKDAREKLEHQANERLRNVRCPAHGTQPRIRILDKIMGSQRSSQLRYRVTNLCCEELKTEVEQVLGSTITLERTN